MLCAEIVGGVVQAVSPQPATYESCTLVIQSGAEVLSSPLLMTRDEAMTLGASIATVWVVLGVIRIVRDRVF